MTVYDTVLITFPVEMIPRIYKKNSVHHMGLWLILTHGYSTMHPIMVSDNTYSIYHM